MKFNHIFLSALIYLLIPSATEARISLPALFSDNMVIQQEDSVKIWGWTNTQNKIEIKPSWDGSISYADAEDDGSWSIYIETPEAGGPYSLSISDGEEITITNILCGEVWLCAGQSNMEMPMRGFPGQPVLGSNDDILHSKNPNIRFISVPRACKTTAQNNFGASWQEAEPKTVANFSATAYHFGKLVQDITGVPVGLIEVSYGGSCIEAWMSRNTSAPFKDRQIPSEEPFGTREKRIT